MKWSIKGIHKQTPVILLFVKKLTKKDIKPWYNVSTQTNKYLKRVIAFSNILLHTRKRKYIRIKKESYNSFKSCYSSKCVKVLIKWKSSNLRYCNGIVIIRHVKTNRKTSDYYSKNITQVLHLYYFY